jgi:shikimate kinase
VATYNTDAINACMRGAQDHTSKYGAVADTFAEVASAPAAYGTLPSSAALSGAVDALNTMLNEEFAAAETRLDGVARALDAVVATVSETDDAHAAAMTPR